MTDSFAQMQVAYHRPSIGPEEIEEVVNTLKSGWLTTGPRTAQFERDFRDYVGAPHAQAVNSCTAGLHLALAALGIGSGDEVITTPITFCSTVNVILHVGASPVLADVGNDGNIDPASIEARITARTRAIVPVHLNGLACEMDKIWDLAREHGLSVIEDSAHAAGAQYRGAFIGNGNPATGARSDASVFSFYATKNLTTGEGGMIVMHDEEMAATVRNLCLHGISKQAWNRYSDRGDWYYEVLQPGFKYNLTDIMSAIGIHQLQKLNDFIEKRTRIAHYYNRIFGDAEEFEIPADKEYCRHAWHLYALRLNLEHLEIDRAEFISQLRKSGIGTSVHFIPIPLHPFFASFSRLAENQCPAALKLYPRLISLPLYPSMTEAQAEYVAETTTKIARDARKRKPVFV